jgi:transcriptional regulator with XRE-family HTH domain
MVKSPIGRPDPVDVHIGARVREIRVRQGMSLTELARAIGVSRQQLGKYEAGNDRISASMLYGIARELGASLDTFVEGLPGAA